MSGRMPTQKSQTSLDLADARYRTGGLRVAGDFYRAALLMLHASDADTILRAHVVATEGAIRFPRNTQLRRLSALALDRFLVSAGRAQIMMSQMEGDARRLVPLEPFECDFLPQTSRDFFLGAYPRLCAPPRR